MSVSEGADAQILREVGQQLARSSSALGDVATSGRAMIRVLEEHWSGNDLDHFAGQAWPSAEHQLHAGEQLLLAMSESALRNAEEQVASSQGDGAGRGGPGGPGGAPGSRGSDRGADDAGQSRPAEDYGELPPEVREAWEGYSRDEKEAIIRQILEERAEHYGIDEPSLSVEPRAEGSWGQWNEPGVFWWQDGTVRLNEDKLDDPMILHTVYHEMRHAGQHEAIRDADTDWPWEDPEYNHGMTEEEVQAWEDNFDDYKGGSEPGYFDQPVEVDAREEGSDFVEAMTPEELERLLEASR